MKYQIFNTYSHFVAIFGMVHKFRCLITHNDTIKVAFKHQENVEAMLWLNISSNITEKKQRQ